MAWQFIGVSSVVEVTATPHALVTTGITGLAAGDLLVACIGSRIASTTSITLPTGGAWTLVAEQKNNNILSTSSAFPSGLMAYCIRGASNPNLTFTHPTAPSVALGRIVAYRDVNQGSPKDTQTAFQTAINTLAVSGTGLTTTLANDLIVAMACGGQEAAWSAFNATSPAGASGATSTAAPTTAWLERADSLTTTGVDTSLAIFDAIKAAAGATGNLTATASVAAGHVIIAGAFKITPAPATGTGTPAAQAVDIDGVGTSAWSGVGHTVDAFNPADKHASIILSNNNLTVDTNLGAPQLVRSRGSYNSGKRYFELKATNLGEEDVGLGIAEQSYPVNQGLAQAGDEDHYAAGLYNSGYLYEIDNPTTDDPFAPYVDGEWVGFAIDFDAGKGWIRTAGGGWFGDPEAGTGNVITFTPGLRLFVAVSLLRATGNDATANFGATAFEYAVPSGFSRWTGQTASVVGVGVASWSGVGQTVDAFNPADKHANIVLSNNNLTTAPLVGGDSFSMIRSRGSYASGKYYFEAVKDAGFDVAVGLATDLTPLDITLGGSTGANWSFGYYDAGQVKRNDDFPHITTGKPYQDAGEWIAIAVDFDAGKAWVRDSTGWVGDPEAGTGNSISFTPNLRLFGAVSFYDDSLGQVTANFGATAFEYVIPSGFSRWTGQLASVSGVGTSSWAATGTLAADAAAVSGSGTVETASEGITGSGAAVADAAAVAGAGLSESTGSGIVVAQAADADGVGVSSSSGTGAAVAQSSAASGVGVSVSAGSGAIDATEAAVGGEGVSSSAGTGALVAQAATVAGTIEVVEGIAGSGTLVATAAGVSGTGEVAETITGSGALIATVAAVAGFGVSSAAGSGAVNVSAAIVAGAGLSESTGTGALACGSATIEGVGIVVEEGVTFGTGALIAGAATVDGVGEVTGEVVQAPIGGGYYRPPRLFPVEGVGYGILPDVEGEAYGLVAVAGIGAGTLPGLSGEADGSIGVAGRSAARLEIKAAAIGVRGQVGAAAAVLECLVGSGSGAAGSRGKGAGVLVTIKGAARGRHDDDEAAVITFLVAA